MPANLSDGGNVVQPPAFSKVAKTKARNTTLVTKPITVDNSDKQNTHVVGEKRDYIA